MVASGNEGGKRGSLDGFDFSKYVLFYGIYSEQQFEVFQTNRTKFKATNTPMFWKLNIQTYLLWTAVS